MNKLEQKIFEEFDRFESHSLYITKQEGARIAAKIALQIAFGAYQAGGGGRYYDEGLGGYSDEFSGEAWGDFKRDIL